MRIAVIGAGYVGLTTAAGFADFGDDVVCCDIDEARIGRLLRGECPIFEPGLAELIKKGADAGFLTFNVDPAVAVRGAEIVFLCVGTPAQPDGAADLRYVLAAAAAIGRALRCWSCVVTKSTVPVGTADKVRAAIDAVTDVPFAVASNPEFLKEGDAVADFMKPDRVVIGTDDDRARAVLEKLYAPFTKTTGRLLHMDIRSAELTKYAANAMLATRVSFMNDIAGLCERVGADVDKVRMGVGLDSRIGQRFLYPGVGWGGSCFGKDVQSAMAQAREHGMRLEILEAVDRVNQRQNERFCDKIAAHFNFDGSLRGRTIALWGLAFKPGTDDIRDAPALAVIDRLLAAGAILHAFDPAAMDAIRARFGLRVKLADSGYGAAAGADALALLTEWHEFRSPNWTRLREIMAGPVVFDGRNIWDPAALRAAGWTYYGVGR
jgi:UDPglucose 6-dehydrogenase